MVAQGTPNPFAIVRFNLTAPLYVRGNYNQRLRRLLELLDEAVGMA